MSLRFGDVVWVTLPAPETDSVRGHEQAGTRPAVVIEGDAFIPRLSIVLVVPMTTNPSVQRFPTSLKINPSNENGLKQISFALPFQLRAIDKRRIDRVVGSLSESDINRLVAELKLLLPALTK
ncbi:MAG: type II toxin-antitoxin system PemK/MazF family toxin [Chitinispirillaceae bacterium]|nr:type II toxin-antitoxin system PemK/MazF family toxin [Chitinispirillaceae bacterium]